MEKTVYEKLVELSELVARYNKFDFLFLDVMTNPSSLLRYQEQVVKPDTSMGWLANQVARCVEKQKPLPLKIAGKLGEIRLELREHYEYDNADVFLARNIYGDYSNGEIDFLIIDKDPKTIEALLLTFNRGDNTYKKVASSGDIDVSPGFL